MAGLLDNTKGPEKRPGKGLMFAGGTATELFQKYLDEVVPAAGAAGDFTELSEQLTDGHEGWETVSDDFGDKVFTEAGGVRLTIVKTKRTGDLMVDLRNWS
jgi:hypothetical protein